MRIDPLFVGIVRLVVLAACVLGLGRCWFPGRVNRSSAFVSLNSRSWALWRL